MFALVIFIVIVLVIALVIAQFCCLKRVENFDFKVDIQSQIDNKNLWDMALQNIKQPSKPKCQWYVANGTNAKSELDIVIIEPRMHPWLRGCLYNIAHVYGGTGASLHIYCGTQNKSYISDIINGWNGVQLHDMNVKNLTINEYSKMLTSAEFWRAPWLTATHVLIFQTDTLTLNKIQEKHLKYDYIGAPWGDNGEIGNGGYSLRNRRVMEELASTWGPTEEPEDLFFASKLKKWQTPTTQEASEFSVEHIYHPNPCGLHQAWLFHSTERVQGWLSKLHLNTI
jgi:hypothetical protein